MKAKIQTWITVKVGDEQEAEEARNKIDQLMSEHETRAVVSSLIAKEYLELDNWGLGVEDEVQTMESETEESYEVKTFSPGFRMANAASIMVWQEESIRNRGGVVTWNEQALPRWFEICQDNRYMVTLQADDKEQHKFELYTDLDELRDNITHELGGGWWVVAIHDLDTRRQLDYFWKLEVA